MTRQEWIDDKLATLRETISIELDLVGIERASAPSDEILELRQRCVAVKASILEQLAGPLDESGTIL